MIEDSVGKRKAPTVTLTLTGKGDRITHRLSLSSSRLLPCLEAYMESLLWYDVQASCCTASDAFKCIKTSTSNPNF
jgi:hypothetical protein